MTCKTKPNFSAAYSKANEMLAVSRVISGFPFSSKELVKEQSNIHFCTYNKAKKKYGLDMTDFGSESAIIFTLGPKTMIFYDSAKPQPHVEFSILHEWGHSVNNHDLGVQDHELYHKYEVETNYFAAQLLMPEQLLRELQRRKIQITASFLQQHFGISKQAAEKRLETLAKVNADWHRNCEVAYDDIILLKYSTFLDRICPALTTVDLQDEYDRQAKRYEWW